MAPKKTKASKKAEKDLRRLQQEAEELLAEEEGDQPAGDDCTSTTKDKGKNSATTDGAAGDVKRLYMMKPPQLAKFSGDGDVEEFVAEARRILMHCSMDAGTKVEWLLSSLTGSARSEVLHRLGPDVSTAEAILAVLVKAFKVQRSVAAMMGDFHGRRQTASQSLLDYAHELETKQDRINNERSSCISDEMLRDQFIEGIASLDLRRELRRFLRANPEASFIAVRAEAQRWHSEDAEMEAAVQHVVATPQPAIPTQQSELQAIQQQLAALTRQMAELKADKKEGQRPPPPSRSGLVCWGCNQRGHLRARCPRNQSSKGQGN